jgi:hypothetical protein
MHSRVLLKQLHDWPETASVIRQGIPPDECDTIANAIDSQFLLEPIEDLLSTARSNRNAPDSTREYDGEQHACSVGRHAKPRANLSRHAIVLMLGPIS